MNTERLHAILIALQSEIASTKSVDVLGKLVESLQNQVNQPQEPSHQQQVAEHLTRLRELLLSVPSNSFSPGWNLIVHEIGGSSILGRHLVSRIDEIFARNQITTSVALEEVQEIHKEHKAFFDAVSKALTSLKHFGIGSESLEPGEAEVGVLIPRAAVNNSLSQFGEELEELDSILNVFSEIVSRERPPLKIRTISSSEFQVFLESVSSISACLAFAIERVVTLYEKLLNIRRLKQELQHEEVPDESLGGITNHANSVMTNGIDQLTGEILETFYEGGDRGRRNEIQTELKFSLKRIANRIDRGYNIEVRAEPIPDDEIEEGAVPDPDYKKRQNYIRIIQEASVRLRYRKMEGDPILSLPESESDGEDRK